VSGSFIKPILVEWGRGDVARTDIATDGRSPPPAAPEISPSPTELDRLLELLQVEKPRHLAGRVSFLGIEPHFRINSPNDEAHPLENVATGSLCHGLAIVNGFERS